MRKLLFVLMAVVLLPVFASAQGSFPSVDDFKLADGALINRAGDSVLFIVGTDTVLKMSANQFRVLDSLVAGGGALYIDTTAAGSASILFPNTNSSIISFYNLDQMWFTDTILANKGIKTTDVDSDTDLDLNITDDLQIFIGAGGTLEATFSNTGLSLPSGYGVSTLGWHTGTYQADSSNMAMSKDYVDSRLVGDSAVTTGKSDGQVMKWSASNSRWEPAADAGAAAGTADSFFINDGTTQYENINNLLKLKEGSGVGITRNDSTSYDVFLLSVDQTWLRSFIDTTDVNIQRSDTATLADSLLGSDSIIHTQVGSMVTGNTVSGITVTYQATDGTLDFSVDVGGSIESSDITDQTIVRADIDSTVGITLGYPSYIENGASADSAIATKGYVDAQVGTPSDVDTNGTQINAALDDRIRTNGDTATGEYLINGGLGLGGNGNNLWIGADSTNVLPTLTFTDNTPTSIALYLFGNKLYINDSIGMSSRNITDLADPRASVATDAATKNYHDTALVAKATYSDSAGGVIDDAITLSDLGQNGASDGSVMKYSTGSGSWIIGSDLTGSGYWDEVSTGWIVDMVGSDTALQIKFTDGGVNPDTVDVFAADGDVLRIGGAGLTDIDSMVFAGDTIVDITGYGLDTAGRALALDTGTISELYVHETGDTMSGALHITHKALGLGLSDSLYFDSTTTAAGGAFKFSDDINSLYGADSSGGSVAGQGNFVVRLDNTPNKVGNLYFGVTGSNTSEFLNYTPTTDSFFLSGVLGLSNLKAPTLTLSNSETITFGSGTFNFTDDITATGGNVYSTNGSFYSNSAGAAITSWYGLYSFDGSPTGAYLRYRGASDFWQSSHPIYIDDTSSTTNDSLLTTQYLVKTLIEDSLNEYSLTTDIEDSLDEYTPQTSFSNTTEVTPFSYENIYGKISDSVFKLPTDDYIYITAPLDDSVAWSADSLNGAVHAQGLYFPNGFWGWKYYITYTLIPTRWSGSSWISYPTGNETPYLAVSNDLNNWTSFTLGGTDTMSLPAIDTREYLRDSSGTAVKADFISDPTLYLEISDEYDTTLWMMYRPVWGNNGANELALACAYLDVDLTGDTTISLVKTNAGGDTLYVGSHQTRTEASGNQDYIAPSLVRKSADNTYHMFSTEYFQDNGIGWANRDTSWYVRWTMNYPCSGLSATADTTDFPISVLDMRSDLGLAERPNQDSALFWHGCTQELYEGVYTVVINDQYFGTISESSPANDGNLWIFNSYDDGLTWHTTGEEIIKNQNLTLNSWASLGYYMSYLMRSDDGLKLVATGRKSNEVVANHDSVDFSWNIGLIDVLFDKQTMDSTLSLIRDTVEVMLDTVTISFTLIDTIKLEDDFIITRIPEAMTVIGLYANLVSGTNVVGMVQEVDNDASSNATNIESTTWTIDGGVDSLVSGFENAALAEGNYLKWITTSTSGDVGFLHVSIVCTKSP